MYSLKFVDYKLQVRLSIRDDNQAGFMAQWIKVQWIKVQFTDQYDKELKEVREGFTKRFFADAAEKKPKANLRIPPAWVYVLYEAWRFNHAVMAPGAAERVQSEKVFGATWRQEVDEVAERILAGIKPGENYENIELYKVKNLKVFEYNRYKAEATVRIGYAIQVFDALGKRHNSQEIIDKGDELWEKHKWHVLYSSQPKALAEDRRAWRAQNWNKNKQDYDKPEPTVGTITSLGDFSSIVNGMVNNPSVVGGSGQGSILRPQSSSSSSSSNDIYNASDQDNKKSSRSSKSHEKKGGHGSSKDNKGKGKDKSGSSGSGLIF
ncbi:hypothetical protein QBC37DRAFT_372142 [Rhypophila decipiens]|uniref:Uncharacterized protein n=1 Tax=Rhypophila decipiens TaxID=261697 RepID=A0AAN6YB68_9PEZI|nr:hypothetical protein QBC37DRAFT_372142 [Rhypophila decipiens]